MFMENPKISVIMPVYNTAKFLPACLESVINQSFQDIEIICVDDCSTDNSLKILNEYAARDSRITVIQNDKNLGPGFSRERGRAISCGKYIYYFDSDDWLENDALSVINDAVSEAEPDLLIFNYKRYDNISGQFSESIDMPKDKTLFNKIVHANDCENLYKIDGSVWNKVFKRDFLVKHKIRFSDLRFMEDYIYYITILACDAGVMLLNDVLTVYRANRNNSLVSQHIQQSRKVVSVYLNLLNYMLSTPTLRYNTCLNSHIMRMFVFELITCRKKNLYFDIFFWLKIRKYLKTLPGDFFDNLEDGQKNFVKVLLNDRWFYFNLKSYMQNTFPNFYSNILTKRKSRL